MGNLVLLFSLKPETLNSVPSEYSENATFIESTTLLGLVPWTGYYMTVHRAKVTISNTYGIWFEIHHHDDTWEAFRLARHSFQLKNWPCEGINLTQLQKTREPLPTSQAPLRAPTPALSHHTSHQTDNDTDNEDNIRRARTTTGDPSSQTPRGGDRRRRPRGTGDDPFTLEDLDDDIPSKGKRLEGIPFTTFDGDRSRTLEFLTEFKSFMLMNDDASIAKNPLKWCSYFLSLVKGNGVRGWTQQ